MHAAGVNPVDTYIRSGSYSRRPTLPYIPGLDSAGTIERVGADVTKFKVSIHFIKYNNECLVTRSRDTSINSFFSPLST